MIIKDCLVIIFCEMMHKKIFPALGRPSLNEKILTVVICLIGVLAVAYGMIRQNHVAFIIGLIFVVAGYLRIRKKLKESIQKKE